MKTYLLGVHVLGGDFSVNIDTVKSQLFLKVQMLCFLCSGYCANLIILLLYSICWCLFTAIGDSCST